MAAKPKPGIPPKGGVPKIQNFSKAGPGAVPKARAKSQPVAKAKGPLKAKPGAVPKGVRAVSPQGKAKAKSLPAKAVPKGPPPKAKAKPKASAAASRSVSPVEKKKKKKEVVAEDYDYDYGFGLGSLFTADPNAAPADPNQSYGAWLGLVDDEEPEPAQARATSPANAKAKGKAGAAKAKAGAARAKSPAGKAKAKAPGKAAPVQAAAPADADQSYGAWLGLYDDEEPQAIAQPKAQAAVKAKAKGKAGGPKAGAKAKVRSKKKPGGGSEASQSDPEDLLEAWGVNALTDATLDAYAAGGVASSGGGVYESLFGEATEEGPVPAKVAWQDTSSGVPEATLYGSLFGGGAADGAEEDEDDEVADDGVFGFTSLFGAPTQGEQPPLPPPPLPPLPPPPPPEPPPPPISRLRPWAPQLRAAGRPREGSRAEVKEPMKTEPQMPPLALDRHVVTVDRRRALPKTPARKDVDTLRGSDATLCVVDGEEILSEPESQGSAESISGDITRSWDPAKQDSRWHYSRDTAVAFSDPWRPLNWSDDQWMKHLKNSGAYNPRAHDEALEVKAEIERLEDEAQTVAAFKRSINTDPAALQVQAYEELQKESTPRGLALKSFVPVPTSDPMMRPALADALKAYKSLPKRDAFGELRVELEGGTGEPGQSSRLGVLPWQEADHCLDKQGRAWL